MFEPAPLPPGYRHRFHAMVKPVGSLCNLDCAYCYYLHKEGLLSHSNPPRMSDDVLEEHIRQYIEAQTGDEVVFSWQGGEPTLLGLDFFRKVVALEAKYKKPNQRIENDLQTNGTLLDEDWARFLKEHNFLVGLSCDGPKRLHDLYRVSGISAGQSADDALRRDGLLGRAEEMRFCEARPSPAVLPGTPPFEPLLERVPQEPVHPRPGRRSVPKLPLTGPETILLAHSARHAGDLASCPPGECSMKATNNKQQNRK